MEKINEEVDVLSYYDHTTKKFRPLRLRWHGRVYKLKEVAHPMHTQIKGDMTYVYNMIAGVTQFILHFNTRTTH